MFEENKQRPGAHVTGQQGSSGGQRDEATNEVDNILGSITEHSGWDVYNNEAKKVDAELVKDWTDSLNFLLLFAAIFSAVLTAFIIESKKLLELDPTTVMVDVMIFYTNSMANGTHTPYVPTEFQPASSAVAINCLFFASLAASLVAALASVVALQWVGDYDATISRGGSSPETRAKRRQFRYTGVVQWKMREIIVALPVLLYFSVVVFFIGLTWWMWTIHQVVGAVVAGGGAIAVLFYATSTLLSVVFVSAPFQTPLTRWIYSISHFPFYAIHRLTRKMRIPKIPAWLEGLYIRYTLSHKREDHSVESRSELGRDALLWLANQLSISQESGRRFMLLVGEMRNLRPELMPTFDLTEASWYSIFDLAGWTYLRSCRAEEVTTQDRNLMEAFLQCYAIPAVQNLVAPTADMDYTTEIEQREYWSQYCDAVGGGSWDINRSRPNYLFLLLRDIPYPSLFSTQEVEIAVCVLHWRNSRCKRWDPATITNWIERISHLPYVMKVLQVIAVAQAADPSVSPLWRTTVPNQVNDPHFAEVLKSFDGLMGPNCIPADHRLLVDLICQELEAEIPPQLDNYFSQARIESLAQLNDPSLQTLANCARGVGFIQPILARTGYNLQRKGSWDRIEQYLLKKYQMTRILVVLELQAALWPTFSGRFKHYEEALTNPDTFLHLQRLFQYPVTCDQCIDGDGHLLFHVLDAASIRLFPMEFTLFTNFPLEGRRMAVPLITLCFWHADQPLPLERLFYRFPATSRRLLEDLFNLVRSSEYHRLALIFNISKAFEHRFVYPEDLAAILVGIQDAIQLPHMAESTPILGPLSASIRRLLDTRLGMGSRPIKERDAISGEAIRTIQLMRSSLACRLISGRQNIRIVVCARGRWSTALVEGHLGPYEG